MHTSSNRQKSMHICPLKDPSTLELESRPAAEEKFSIAPRFQSTARACTCSAAALVSSGLLARIQWLSALRSTASAVRAPLARPRGHAAPNFVLESSRAMRSTSISRFRCSTQRPRSGTPKLARLVWTMEAVTARAPDEECNMPLRPPAAPDLDLAVRLTPPIFAPCRSA